MAAIFPISTSRVSDAMVNQRLLAELQVNESDLLKAQTQVSTGLRYSVPSEDPSSAVRALGLQRLLEQKKQIQTNVAVGQSYLAATDNAIGDIHGLLAEVRGLAVTATGDTADDDFRSAVSSQIRLAADQLMTIGNREFRGRNLFAGSVTEITPFETQDGFVLYNGNLRSIQSFSDIGTLFDTNSVGHDVFGALSPQVVGTADLTPRLTEQTRLADLRSGAGIPQGSIAISDGSSTSTIDVGAVETIGDLVRIIEASPPTGRTLTVDVTSTGLDISIDVAAGGNLTIKEVGGGHTAAELGILRTQGIGTAPIVGEDIDPRLTLTTGLSDIATAFDQFSGIQIVNGDQTHVLDFAAAETVEDLLNILNGSEAGVLAEMNADGSGLNLLSRLSGSDFHVGENGGTTATDLGIRSLTQETPLADLNYGLGVNATDGTDFTILRTDGVVLDIDVSALANVGEVIDQINNHPDNTPAGAVVAQLAEYGNGITLTEDNLAGAGTLSVTRSVGSFAARDLGLIAADADVSSLSTNSAPATATLSLPPPDDTNTGFVVAANTPGTEGNDVEIVFTGGQVGDVALVTFDAVGRQLLIDIDPTQTTTNTIIAEISSEGTLGATLDTTTDLTNDGTGLFNAVGTLATTGGGRPNVIEGTDSNPLETRGIFNTLTRLADALQENDLSQIERTAALLDQDMERARFAQAESGARLQGLDAIQQRLEDEEVELKTALSLEVDMDLAAAISDLTTKQVAFEASLRSMGQIFQLSLLNFL